MPIAAAPPSDRSSDLPSSEDLAVRERSACDARQIEDLARDDAEPLQSLGQDGRAPGVAKTALSRERRGTLSDEPAISSEHGLAHGGD